MIISASRRTDIPAFYADRMMNRIRVELGVSDQRAQGLTSMDSGALLYRPGLNRFRDGVQANAFDAILILSPDCLSRKCADLIRMLREFERLATPVEFVEQPLLQLDLDSDRTYGDDEADACPLTLSPLPRPEGVRA